jgi:hypothetical protein
VDVGGECVDRRTRVAGVGEVGGHAVGRGREEEEEEEEEMRKK